MAYNNKGATENYGPGSKVTEVGVYSLMALLSDVGGILKIMGILFTLATSYCYSMWIKT